MPKWSTTAAATLLRDVLIPLGGLYGMLFDRPLDPLPAGAYLLMMGLPLGGAVDRILTRRGGTSDPTRPPGDLPPTTS